MPLGGKPAAPLRREKTMEVILKVTISLRTFMEDGRDGAQPSKVTGMRVLFRYGGTTSVSSAWMRNTWHEVDDSGDESG